jgi:hypothetical protein
VSYPDTYPIELTRPYPNAYPSGFHKKRAKTRYVKLVFLLPVGYAGHVVLSGAYGPQNVDALVFMLGWDWCGFQKKARWDMLH